MISEKYNKGILLKIDTDVNTYGPANLVLKDPDGNVILIDQHIIKNKTN